MTESIFRSLNDIKHLPKGVRKLAREIHKEMMAKGQHPWAAKEGMRIYLSDETKDNEYVISVRGWRRG